MKKARKIVSLVCAFVMLASVSAIPTFAESVNTDSSGTLTEENELTYLYDEAIKYVNCGDHVKITSVKYGSAIIIPEKIDNLPVTELAKEAFKENYGVESVILPETITVIPEEAFYHCWNLTAIVLPKSLERIENNAFAKCERNVDAGNPVYHQIEDIFYKGSSEDWDKIYIASGNDLLKTANIRCEFNQVKSDSQKFEYTKDSWSFTEDDVIKYSDLEKDGTKYYFQESTLNKLFPDYASYRKYQAITHCDYSNYPHDKYTEDGEFQEAPDLERCEGMALISFLVSRGILLPPDIYAGAETLHDIPLCDEVVEVINYYALAVTSESLYTRIYHQGLADAKCSYKTSVNNLIKDLEDNGKPFMANLIIAGETYTTTIDDLIAMGFYDDVREIDDPDWEEVWTTYKNHYAVVYGLEYGKWNYNNTSYTSRILFYDNSSVDFDDSLCMYFTEEQTKAGKFNTQGYIPYYDANAGIYDALESPDSIFYSIGNSVNYTPSFALGDLNQDNVINSEDAALVLQTAAMLGVGGGDNLNVGQEYSADVNGDGKINSEDASWILQYSAATGSGEFSGEFSQYILERYEEFS